MASFGRFRGVTEVFSVDVAPTSASSCEEGACKVGESGEEGGNPLEILQNVLVRAEDSDC